MTDAAGKPIAVEAYGLSAALMGKLAALPADDAQRKKLLSMHVVSGDSVASSIALLGAYSARNDALRFTPRFPLTPGLRYRAALHSETITTGARTAAAPITLDVVVPSLPVDLARTRVQAIYPSGALLPENQLRFYVHFSAPMSRGEAYRRLDLLDATGKPIELAFLEIGEELWDPAGRRLTLLIDPGRIKRGLKPREEMGPVLEAGKSYTLLIRPDFPDARGRPLAQEFRKSFRVGPPIESRIDAGQWTIAAPAAGAYEPVVVGFGRPLDRALLDRLLWIEDGAGQRVAGISTIADEEKRWEFRPSTPWSAGNFRLIADVVLEDQAGNNLARPFEVDENLPVDSRPATATIAVPFVIQPKSTSQASTGRFADLRRSQWHHWRGPEANGTAPTADPPIRWTSNAGVRWKTPLDGRGSSTPIVWAGRIFLTTAIDTGRVADPKDIPKPDPRFKTMTQMPNTYHRFVVMCFDVDDGKVIWRHEAAERVPHEGRHTTHSYAAGSPTTDGERLYVSFGSYGNYCFTLDGRLLWRRDLPPLHTRNGWGEAVTPVYHRGSLILNWDQEADSQLYRVDATTGKDIWRIPRDEPSTWSTPCIVEYNGKTQVIANGTNRIRSYDFETGTELWRCSGMSVNAIPSPVVDGAVAYVMSGYRGFAARAVRLGAKGEATAQNGLVWKYDRGTPYVPSPALSAGRLYFTQANNALLTVLDAKSGTPILDRVRLPGQSAFYASPIAAAGRIYLVDRSGTTLVLKQSDRLEVLATNRLDDPIDASPAAVGARLYLRGEKFLYCIEGPSNR